MKKQAISLALALILTASLSVPTFATTSEISDQS